MLVKKLVLNNFQCYFGKNVFEFTNGLNIILGENGEGKTKMIEAFEWLFDSSKNDDAELVSMKKLHEAKVNDRFNVSVELFVEQYNESRSVIKSFIVEKNGESNSFSISKVTTKAFNETLSGERVETSSSNFLNQILHPEIRRYSVLKGEESLNIFENKDALKDLITIFSDAASYDEFNTSSNFLLQQSEKTLDKIIRQDSSSQKKLKIANFKLDDYGKKLVNLKTKLKNNVESIEDYNSNINKIESQIDHSKELSKLSSKIKLVDDQIKNKPPLTSDFTTLLFDESWILKNFKSIQSDFNSLISSTIKARQKLESEYNFKKGEKNALALSLLNNKSPLPINMPSIHVMYDMISDEICKVCNREALKGSEAYEYMTKKINAFIDDQNKVEEESDDESLFKHNYLNKLHYLSQNLHENIGFIKNIPNEIKDRFEFNDRIRSEISDLKSDRSSLQERKVHLVGTSDFDEEKMHMNMQNYRGWTKDREDLRISNKDIISEIKELESKILDQQKIKSSLLLKGDKKTNKLVQINSLFKDISLIFNQTKHDKFNEFVDDLEKRSNDKFSIINEGAFTGQILFTIKNLEVSPIVSVKLVTSSGDTFSSNKSLETSMNIAILLAISDLTNDVREDRYPLLMDAPVSSFGKKKTSQLFKVINSIQNQQTIIVLKDYIEENVDDGSLFISSDFKNVKRNKAMWVKLDRPFDKKRLETLNTNVINI